MSMGHDSDSDVVEQLNMWRTTSQFTVQLLAGGSIALGLILLIADPLRLSSPTFLFIRETPGGPMTWGLVLAVLGVALLVSQTNRVWLMTSHYLLGIVNLMFAAAIVAAALNEADGAMSYIRPSLTGIPAYVVLGLLHIVRGTANLGVWRASRRRGDRL